MLDILAKAPPWAAMLFWALSAVFASVFWVAVPKLKSMITRVAPVSLPDTTMRVVGAMVGQGLDGAKIAHEIERAADALETIAEGVTSLARSEEQGTARTLAELVEQMQRLDHKIDRRP